MSDDSQRWRDIARAYAERTQTVGQICAQFGVTKGALYDRMRLEGWPRRRDGCRAQSVAGPDWDRVALRLYGALERKISELEDVMASREETLDASNRERDARTLNGLVRTFEKLREMDRQQVTLAKSESAAHECQGSQEKPKSASDDHADLRAELAARIARLKQLAD